MATYKQVTLKDPKTGDYLIPRVYGTIGYQVVDGEITPPFDPQLDAYTLQGHPASYFATANHTHTQYADKVHVHEINAINGLQSEIDSLKSSVSSGKATIASAVTDKGVQTAADATFQQMATNIGKIELSFNKIDTYGIYQNAYRYDRGGSSSYPSDWTYNTTLIPYLGSSFVGISPDDNLKINLLIKPGFANFSTGIKPEYTSEGYMLCEFGKSYEITNGIGTGNDQYITFMINNPRLEYYDGNPYLPIFDIYSKSHGLYTPSSDKYYALFAIAIVYK